MMGLKQDGRLIPFDRGRGSKASRHPKAEAQELWRRLADADLDAQRSTAASVLLCLWSHANSAGATFVGKALLCQRLGTTRRSLDRAISALSGAGAVIYLRGPIEPDESVALSLSPTPRRLAEGAFLVAWVASAELCARWVDARDGARQGYVGGGAALGATGTPRIMAEVPGFALAVARAREVYPSLGRAVWVAFGRMRVSSLPSSPDRVDTELALAWARGAVWRRDR